MTFQSMKAAILAAAILAAGASAAGDENEQAAKPVPLAQLRAQAQRVKKECPELFDFLSKRDVALQGALVEMADQIPHPERLPKITIPESLVVELAQPKSEEECKHILEEQDNRFGLKLPPGVRNRLYWLCVHGIYIRSGSISELAR